MQTQKRNNLILSLAFTLLVGVDFGLFFVPAFIIQPFRFQSPRTLMVAMEIRQEAPVWTLVTTVAALLVAWFLWGRISWWKRAPLILGLCLAAGSAVMARVDYFEWMFHPVAAPGFESATNTKLDASEMVMAVRFASDARAYPIRAMAYHHVVNDVVGSVPIAVTY